MKTPHDLLLHDLSDMYQAEQLILKALPKMIQSAQDPQVKSLLQEHEQETRQQVQNLEQAFTALGAKPEQVQCKAVQGLVAEREDFLKEQPAPEVLQLFDLGAAAKTEHYEMAAYRGMLEKARLMGHTQVVQLLQQNLQQEERMAQRVEQLGKQVGQQVIAAAGQVQMEMPQGIQQQVQ